jgi:ABC-type lipoprotein export system ATPase subunit
MQLVADSIGIAIGSRTLFSGLTVRLESGMTTALMGPSGVGKSTLLGALAGVIPLTTGSLRVENHGAPLRVSWMFQNAPLLFRRSAIDNVAVAHELMGTPRVVALERASSGLASLGLSEIALTAAHRLSGGERQRVAVARAIAASADLLLADEPTASLDSASRQLVLEALLSASRDGAALVIATHDPWVAERCDQVVGLQASSITDND